MIALTILCAVLLYLATIYVVIWRRSPVRVLLVLLRPTILTNLNLPLLNHLFSAIHPTHRRRDLLSRPLLFSGVGHDA